MTARTAAVCRSENSTAAEGKLAQPDERARRATTIGFGTLAFPDIAEPCTVTRSLGKVSGGWRPLS
ncbi:hypothetical protein OG339_47695 (plasmid) [Streptosporangium sp. NBC_01495]|uniref:hypothetical protein n=1 Tax=Streptosporangium sp. NBC_01495 TaxID=2903899 RepID=UPI002E32CE60|nr:hypothetical protein [Streptosporangium sp. NBC_01495]